MYQDVTGRPGKNTADLLMNAVVQSSANQVLFISLSSYLGLLKHTESMHFLCYLLGSHIAAVGSIQKSYACEGERIKIITTERRGGGGCWKQTKMRSFVTVGRFTEYFPDPNSTCKQIQNKTFCGLEKLDGKHKERLHI